MKLLAVLLVIVFPACSDGWIGTSDDSQSGDGDLYIMLKIAVPSGESSVATRANPMGGEDGNGREDGILNEDKIHDLNIFFYNDGQGMNGNSDATVSRFYFNLDNPDDPQNTVNFEKTGPSTENGNSITYYEIKFQYDGKIKLLDKSNLKFITVANAKNTLIGISTLGTLREFTGLKKTWTGNSQNVGGENYDGFVMSTAYSDQTVNGVDYGSSTIDFSRDGTQTSPYLGETTVERLCARLDLWYNSADNADNSEFAPSELVYSVKGNNDAEIAKVHVTNVLPVNVMQKSSYLLKKVTDETAMRSDWSASALGGINTFKWGGVEVPHPNTNGDRPSNYVIEPTTLLKSAAKAGDITAWYGSTATSAVKEAITQKTSGNVGSYLHIVNGNGNLSDYNCDRVAVIGYTNENTHPTDCFISDYLTGLAFRAIYQPNKVIASYNPDDQENPFTYDDSDYSTGKTFYRYSPTGQKQSEASSLYFENMDALNSYKSKHTADNAEVTTFTNGVCYYNLWLKHYDDVDDQTGKSDPHAALPMEYATVRNNIYRVAISFTGPGDPTPELREPNHIHSRIFVRPWNQRKETNPIMF